MLVASEHATGKHARRTLDQICLIAHRDASVAV
jgi:hypothetical protein